VTEITSPIAESPRASTAARVGLGHFHRSDSLRLLLQPSLALFGFVGPDEPRYAWIARDMAETGDWVTPRLYGKPWFEKPPLLYWGAALCFQTLRRERNCRAAAERKSPRCSPRLR